jgi:hypothetical protein
MPRKIYKEFILKGVEIKESKLGMGMRRYCVFLCPHCQDEIDVSEASVVHKKGGACSAHLSVCSVFKSKQNIESTENASTQPPNISELTEELRLLRKERDEDRTKFAEEREASKRRHEEEREASKRRHEELMSQLTAQKQQLTEVQTQLPYKRKCLTDVREWGELNEPDNTLVPQLTLRENSLLQPLRGEILLLKQKNMLLTERAPNALVRQAAEAEERARKAQKDFAEYKELTDRQVHECYEKFKAKEKELQTEKQKSELYMSKYKEAKKQRHTLPQQLLIESEHARKYSMVAFHPDKQPNTLTDRAKEWSDSLYKQASSVHETRSSGTHP